MEIDWTRPVEFRGHGNDWTPAVRLDDQFFAWKTSSEALGWTIERIAKWDQGSGGMYLRNKPEKHARYLNVYMGANHGHSSRANADLMAKLDNISGHSRRIACVRIEFEDGQFDD